MASRGEKLVTKSQRGRGFKRRENGGGGEGNCFLIDCSFGRERGRVGGALSNEIR